MALNKSENDSTRQNKEKFLIALSTPQKIIIDILGDAYVCKSKSVYDYSFI